jgi:hypothetical protein
VQRPAEHPLRRPTTFRSTRQRSAVIPSSTAVGTFEQDIDQPGETPKPMQYWMRELVMVAALINRRRAVSD